MAGESWLPCWPPGAGAQWCCWWGTLSGCCCQRKIPYRCRERGPEAGLAEECHFTVWVYFTETVDPGCVCLRIKLGMAQLGLSWRLGGVGVGLAPVAAWECCWGCTCETVPRHLTWSGSLPAQPSRCSQSWRCLALPCDFWPSFTGRVDFRLLEHRWNQQWGRASPKCVIRTGVFIASTVMGRWVCSKLFHVWIWFKFL